MYVYIMSTNFMKLKRNILVGLHIEDDSNFTKKLY